MLSIRRAAILLLLSAVASRAQHALTTAGRLQDLNYVATTLSTLAPNFFYQLDRPTYASAVAALRARVSTATDPEFYVGLAQLVAMAGDMHTSLTPEPAFAYTVLPLSLTWLEDGLFVTSAAPEYAQTIGTQVVAVNGMPIAQVTQLLGTVFAHANDQWLRSQVAARLPSLFLLQGLDIIPAFSSAAPMTFQTLAGKQFSATIGPSTNALKSGLPGPTPEYLRNPGTYYWYTYIPENRMLYAKYNICADDPNGISVAAYGAQIIKTLDANPVDTVVIDFRENYGGNEFLLYPLGAGLFQRLATLTQNPNFRIYLVIDKGSFSSGMYTPMAFKSGLLAIVEKIPNPSSAGIMYVIGEPTGGKPIGFGNALGFSLPYSVANGEYSTSALTSQNEGVIPDLPTFNPDIFVPTRSTDYFAGFDPVMAAMLARYTGPPPASSGAVTTVNGANFRADEGVAPGSFAAAFGTFATTPDQILVGGTPSTITAATTSQVNFVVPASAAPGMATISVRAAGLELASGQAAITSASPGIFVLDATNPSQPGAVENQDGSVNSPKNPAPRGSALAIYATGYGNTSTQVYFGDTPAQVLYSAPVQGVPGLWQINVQVPTSLSPGTSSVFVITANSASNPVTVTIQ